MAKSVVVIGGGQGGLSAAVHARLAGADVLLLEQRDTLGGKAARIDISGYQLDPGPSIVILPRIYESVFHDAGRRMEDYLRFQRLDPISTVHFRGERIALPAARTECEALVDSIDPQDGRMFRRMMKKLDGAAPHIDRSVFAHPYHSPHQMMDPHLISVAMRFDFRKTYRELVDGWFRSPLLRAFFYGFPSYGGQTYESKAPGALMIPYLMIQEGVYYPEGGVSAIPRAFARLAQELGVKVQTATEVVGLDHENGRVSAARLATGERVEAEVFISNRDRLTTAPWLGRTVPANPSLSYFTIHWGIRKKFPNAAHHVLLIPDGFESGFQTLYRKAQFPVPPIVYLNVTSEIDPDTAPEGCSNVFAVVTTPAMEPNIDWNAPEGFVTLVRDLMAENGFAFQNDEIEFERIQTPQTFAERDGNYKGSLYGPTEKERLFGGLFPLRVIDEEFANLFYCGGSVQPGAGLPMVTLSGKFAANLAMKP